MSTLEIRDRLPLTGPDTKIRTAFFRSCAIWLGTSMVILAWLPVVSMIRLLDRTPMRRRTSAAIGRLNQVLSRINPYLNIELEGLENIEPATTYLVVSNHQSITDIPLISRLPLTLKWVAKKSLFDVPVTGWMMRMAGDIPVDLRNPKNKQEVLNTANKCLQQNCSVLFFPEGRRTSDGRLNRFGRGAFELAVSTKTPVLPIVIDGLYQVLPSAQWKFRTTERIRLRVLPPVETNGMAIKDAEYLRERIRFKMLQQLSAWRNQPEEQIDGVLLEARENKTDEKVDCPLFY